MKDILLPHNIKPYQKLTKAINEKGKACAVQPTGTGKMFLAINWLMDNPNKSFVYIAPTNAILNSFIDNLVNLLMPESKEIINQMSLEKSIKYINSRLGLNISLMTYSKINYMKTNEIEKMQADHIVLDEFHHLGADKWGSSVEYFLHVHPNAKVLGLTATPIRPSDGKDMVKYLFNGTIDSELTLKECFEKNILKTPTLINGIYSFAEEVNNIENSLKQKKFSYEKEKEIETKLKQAKKLISEAKHGIKGILDENLTEFKLPNGKLNVKLIVFCNSIEDRHKKMDECKTWFEHGTKIKKYSITSEEKKETINKVIRNFEQDKAQCVKLIFVVDMLNEGIHIKDVDGVLMLRSTESQVVFLQQLGRALSVGEQNKKSPLVFDLTNNIEVLAKDIDEVNKTGLTYTKSVNEPKQNIENSVFNIQSEVINIISYLKNISLDFNDKILLLSEYYKEHGTISDIVIYNNSKLGNLIHNLRTDFKRGKLSDDEIKILNNMGMVWQVQPKDWFTPFFEKLVAYKEKNGTFNGILQDPEIGNTVNNVRQSYKGLGTIKLSQEIIEKLNSINFPWSIKKDWFTPFFEKLIAYKEKNGTFYGVSSDEEIGQLAGRVRQAYRGSGHMRLTEEMINKLNSINFPWNVELKGPQKNWFDSFFENVVKYKETHGGFDGITKDKIIGSQVCHVKNAHKGKGDTKLTQEMIDKLDSINFPWIVKKDWFTPFYEKLISYKEEHGTFVGASSDKEIGQIISRVRRAYRGHGNIRLTQEMIDKLNVINFTWNLETTKSPAEVWFKTFFNKLIAYKELNGSFKGVTSDPEIGDRVVHIRAAYKGTKGGIRLTKEMIDKLDSIGFPWVVRNKNSQETSHSV